MRNDEAPFLSVQNKHGWLVLVYLSVTKGITVLHGNVFRKCNGEAASEEPLKRLESSTWQPLAQGSM